MLPTIRLSVTRHGFTWPISPKREIYQNYVILSILDAKFSKVNQMIYSSVPIVMLNMNVVAQILLRYLKNQSKVKNCVILSKFDIHISNNYQVIYSSAPINTPNMKALGQILFEISCTQDFQILRSKGYNSERDITLTYRSTIFS